MLYWYQSTDSVVGMSGTSLIMYDEICLISLTCVSGSAAAYWSNSLSTSGLM